ncbi:MAG: methylated-DNA--[protein]-cysteine S-methyltransferase [Thiohalocapsa sp.]
MISNERAPSDAASCATLDTPLGTIGVRWRGKTVTGIDLDPEPSVVKSDLPPEWFERQIRRYCREPGFSFSLPTALAGTAFQRRVWQLIRVIPAGRTRTYSDMATELDSSPRAVGGACRANPYPLLVPCHRVVAVNGLGGFAGDSGGRLLAMKRRLLAHEGAWAPG